jgi:hypothetical protein
MDVAGLHDRAVRITVNNVLAAHVALTNEAFSARPPLLQQRRELGIGQGEALKSLACCRSARGITWTGRQVS